MEDGPPDPPPDLDDVATAAVARIAAALRARDRKTYRTVIVDGEFRFTLGAARAAPNPDADLPERVARLSKATRRVYRVLCELRAERGTGERIWQSDVHAAIGKRTPKEPLSLRTVHRALKALCKENEVQRHDDLGFLVGGQQPSLPF